MVRSIVSIKLCFGYLWYVALASWIEVGSGLLLNYLRYLDRLCDVFMGYFTVG
jgi:hypothetical protein